jgi:hypothetical protein
MGTCWAVVDWTDLAQHWDMLAVVDWTDLAQDGDMLGCCGLDLKQTQIHNTTVTVSALHCCSHSLMLLRGSDRAWTELFSEELHDW